MTHRELLEVLARSAEPSTSALVRAAGEGKVHPVMPGPGRDSATSLRSIYQIHRATTTAAGIPTFGFEATLAALANVVPDEAVLVHAFLGPTEAFTVFVREVDGTVLGCIQVLRSQQVAGSPHPTESSPIRSRAAGTFTATLGAAEQLDDLETFAVVLCEHQDGSGRRLELQRSLLMDEADKEAGMDTYCLCTETGATHYGGVLAWRLERSLLAVGLEPKAARVLDLQEELLIELRLDDSTIEQIRAGLHRMLD